MSIIAEIQSKGLDKLAEDFKKSAQAGKELNSELQTKICYILAVVSICF